MKSSIIQRGAEAVIYRRESKVVKKRVRKGYRLLVLDEKIRKLRTRGEGRLLERAGKIISVPGVLRVDEKASEIGLAFINGKKLSEHLDGLKNWRAVCVMIGENVGKMHDAGIIHGDLTTSNMILASKIGSQPPTRIVVGRGDKSYGGVYFIDFGLGYHSSRAEDKAVDLHLLKHALEARHYLMAEKLWNAVVLGYKKTSAKAREVLKRLEKVEKRGRYKQQY